MQLVLLAQQQLYLQTIIKDLFVNNQLKTIGLRALWLKYSCRYHWHISGISFLNVESALDAWWALSSIFSGGMLGLFLLGYVTRKARNVDAVLGVICGVIVVVWMSLSPILFTDGFGVNTKARFMLI